MTFTEEELRRFSKQVFTAARLGHHETFDEYWQQLMEFHAQEVAKKT